jgi:hypothetical protein
MTLGRLRKPVRREVSDRNDAIYTNLRWGPGDCRLFESLASDRLGQPEVRVCLATTYCSCRADIRPVVLIY